MADIKLTTADTAGFIPQFWAQRALDVLRSQITLANLVARDVDFAPGWKGKSLNIPYPGTFATVDKVADTPVTPQVPTGSNVVLTLNKHKVVPFLIEDFANAQANMDLMDRYIEPAVIAIAEQFETDLWATAATLGTIAPIGTAGTDLAAAVVRTANKALNDAKAPQTQRYLVMSTKDQAAILGDTNLATYFAFSQADSIKNGYIGRLYGLDTFWSQLAPLAWKSTHTAATTYTYGGQTTGSVAQAATAATVQTAIAGLSSVGAGNVAVTGPTGGPYNIVFLNALLNTGTLTASTATIAAAQLDLAFHRNAMMYAVRPFPATPAGQGVDTAQAMDPETGLSIRISKQYDINNVGVRCNLDILYGSVALRPNQAIAIET